MNKKFLLMASLFVMILPFAFAENQNITNESINTTLNVNSAPYFVTGPILEDTDPAPVDELDLFPATTTRVWCNGTVNDTNGYGDLAAISGVLYNTASSSAGAADDPTNHYSDADCNVSLNTDGTFSCEFDLEFYALPGNWTCVVTVTDSASQSASANDTSNVTELLAIDVPGATLDFGNLKEGENTTTVDYNVTVTNNGNIQIDLTLDAWTSWASPDPNDANAMACDVGNIGIGYLRYALSGNVSYDSKTQLVATGGVTASSFDLAPQTSGATGTTRDVAFGIGVPASGVGGTCNGVLNFLGIKG